MALRAQCSRQPKPLAAGVFQQSIDSFRLYLSAEGKADKTVRTYVEAVQWFAAAHLLARTGRTGWAEVDREDIQRWMVWLLDNYSDAYASNQYRALQQFFRWWSEEEDLPDPFARLRPPKVREKLVPAEQHRSFTEEVRRTGSVSAARHRVLPPEESRHVRGLALDVRPTEGARWLEQHGERYGLYRVYDNEWWHFEYHAARSARLPHPGAGQPCVHLLICAGCCR